VADLTKPAPTEEVQAEETANNGPDLLDRTWDFFASVPVATLLLFIIAIVSVAGTLIEQEGQYQSYLPPAQFYPQRYGPVMGPLLMGVGLTHAYMSWWYLALLGMVVTSLVVCSLQRFVPLYKAVQHPPVGPVPGFLRHLKWRLSFAPTDENPLEPATNALKAMGYKVTAEGDRILAEKGRWNRWGPYVLHTGLILIALGALARAIPGFYSDTTLWVRDGEVARVPGADWFVKSEKFTAEFYPDGRPKLYSTDAVVIDGGKEVKRQTIKMNEPLAYRGIELYQSSYNQSLGSIDVLMQEKVGENDLKDLGKFTVDLAQPAKEYKVGAVTLTPTEYFPDFAMDELGKPSTKSGDPNNPAIQFKATGYDKPLWFFAAYPEMQFDPKAPYTFKIAAMSQRSSTGLKVKKDVGLNIIWVGLFVIVLGTSLTFYLSHRRIWGMVDGKKVLLAGQCNRDKMTFTRDMRRLSAALPGAEIEQLGG